MERRLMRYQNHIEQDTEPTSNFTNVTITGSDMDVGACNDIRHPVDMEDVQIYCSTISSFDNYFKNVFLTNSHVYFANIQIGNVMDSIVERGSYVSLNAENESYIYATDEQSFSNLKVNQSRLNFTTLTHDLDDVSFENTVLYGVSQMNIPEDYTFSNVRIFVDSLLVKTGVVLDRVYLGGMGEISIENDVKINNSGLYVDTDYVIGDSELPSIIIHKSAEVSDSYINGNVTVEEEAKILENSIVSNSMIGEKATISHSLILQSSEIQSMANVTGLSRVIASTIEPNVNVINSDIKNLTLKESAVAKTCLGLNDGDYHCEDGSQIAEWEVFEYVDPFEDEELLEDFQMGLASSEATLE